MYADDSVVFTHAETAELAAAKLTAAKLTAAMERRYWIQMFILRNMFKKKW